MSRRERNTARPPPGVKIKDLTLGEGPLAKKGSIVQFHYECFLPQGDLLCSDDWEIEIGQREDSRPAFNYGIPGMAQGGIRTVTVSPNLTYNERHLFPDLPDGATLRYEIKLIKVSDRWSYSSSVAKEPLESALLQESVSQLLVRVDKASASPSKWLWLLLQELARRRGAEAEAGILKLLDFPDPYIQRYLIEKLTDEEHVTPFLKRISSLLGHSNLYIVTAACRAIAAAGSVDSDDAFIALLASPKPEIVLAAVDAIGKLNVKRALPDLLKLYDKAIIRNETVLMNFATADNWREIFARFVKSDIPRFRCSACELIIRYGTESDLELLEVLKRDPDGHVRKAASRAFAQVM